MLEYYVGLFLSTSILGAILKLVGHSIPEYHKSMYQRTVWYVQTFSVFVHWVANADAAKIIFSRSLTVTFSVTLPSTKFSCKVINVLSLKKFFRNWLKWWRWKSFCCCCSQTNSFFSLNAMRRMCAVSACKKIVNIFSPYPNLCLMGEGHALCRSQPICRLCPSTSLG